MSRLNEIIGRMPFIQWGRDVTRRTLKADLLAGLTGAVIVLPQGVAFALIAGLPPEYGLYAAMIPAIVAALMGSSLHLVSGPTTAISIVIFTSLSPLVTPGTHEYISMALTLTFMAGLFQFALGVARLGALVNFVSHSVVVGFTAGAAILIASSQFGGLLGIASPKKHSFIHVLGAIYGQIGDTNLYALSVGLATLAIAITFKHLRPKWPGMLIAMVGGSALSLIMDGAVHGVRLLGPLPASLPPLSAPEITTGTLRQLAPSALAVAMLGLAEAVSIARAVATKSEQRIDSNQEFIGQGLANVIGSFFSGYASSGSFTRTGVNFEAGARTPLAAVFAAIFLAVMVLLIAPLTAYLPMAAMAGILMFVAYGLIDQHHIAAIFRTSRAEAGIMLATFLSTLFVELEFAIYVGVLLSLLIYLNRTSHPHLVAIVPSPRAEHRRFVNAVTSGLPECPQMKIIRMDGSIFFGAVDQIAQDLEHITRDYPEQAHILLVGSGMNFVDVGGCTMIAQEAHRLKLSGRQIYLCSLKAEVRETLTRGGCTKGIGEDNIFKNKEDALISIVPRLDPERCRACRLRIFNECAMMPKPDYWQGR